MPLAELATCDVHRIEGHWDNPFTANFLVVSTKWHYFSHLSCMLSIYTHNAFHCSLSVRVWHFDKSWKVQGKSTCSISSPGISLNRLKASYIKDVISPPVTCCNPVPAIFFWVSRCDSSFCSAETSYSLHVCRDKFAYIRGRHIPPSATGLLRGEKGLASIFSSPVHH